MALKSSTQIRRSMQALVFGAAVLAPGCALADGASWGMMGGGIMQGYQEGQMRHLELQHMQQCLDLERRGYDLPSCGQPVYVSPTPAPVYQAPPLRRSVDCMWYGPIWSCD